MFLTSMRSHAWQRPALAGGIASLAAAGMGALITLQLSWFDLLALTFAAVLGPLAAFHPDLLVAIFLGLLWARVSDVGIAQHALPSLALPFAIGLLFLSIWKRLAKGERISLATFSHAAPVVPYLIVVSLSTLWATAPDRALSTAVDLAKDVLIFWVLVELIHSVRTLKMCCLALTFVTGALGALSVYQQATSTFTSAYGGFAQASLRQIVGSVSLYRLGGPIGDPNYYALILLVVVPLGLALLRTPLSFVVRAVVACATLMTVVAVFLTYSRGGALVLALACLLSLAHSHMRLAVVAGVAIALPVAVMFAPTSLWDRLATIIGPFEDTGRVGQVVDESVELRLGAQRVALEMFLDSPLGGVGAGNYPVLYQDYSQRLGVAAVATEFYPHDLYLQVAAETGALGLLTFVPAVVGPLVLLGMMRRVSRTGSAQMVEWQTLSAGVEIALVCYLVASLMLHASYPRYLWMLLGIAVATRRVAPLTTSRI